VATIVKKAWPEAFQAIADGQKTFDLRLADFDCQPGDTLVLQEWDPKTKQYTGREIVRRVGFIAKSKEWEVWPKTQIDALGFQVLSLLDEPVAE
jgi:hypothetical protein